MRWTELKWGRHAGKTLPQIIFCDGDWFFWAYEEDKFMGHQAQEACELYRRARSIRVPARNGKRMLVEYIIHYTGEFGTMGLIADEPGIEHLNVSDTIDFYVPRFHARYDKMGYNLFVSALTAIFFGNSQLTMDRKTCEAFFNDDSNFYLPQLITT
jgi:hypothetical protein